MAVLIIRLEIDGDARQARTIIETMLDNGDPQDGINDHDCDDCDCPRPCRIRVRDAQVKIEET